MSVMILRIECQHCSDDTVIVVTWSGFRLTRRCISVGDDFIITLERDSYHFSVESSSEFFDDQFF
mgnify:FL=1